MMRVADRFLVRTALWPAQIAWRDDRLARWRREPWLCEAMAYAGHGPRRGGTTEFALLKELFRSVLRVSPGDYRSALSPGEWGSSRELGAIERKLVLDERLRAALPDAEEARSWLADLEAELARQPPGADPAYIAAILMRIAEVEPPAAWSGLRAHFRRETAIAFDPAGAALVAEAAELLAHLLPDAEVRDAYVARRLRELRDPARWDLAPADRAVLFAPEPLRTGDALLAGTFAGNLLVDVALDDVRWSWGGLAAASHLPRVTCGGVVLAPETWRVAAASQLAHCSLPRFVEVANLDLALPLDRADASTPAILAELAPKLPELVVRELLPPPPDFALSVAHRICVQVTGSAAGTRPSR